MIPALTRLPAAPALVDESFLDLWDAVPGDNLVNRIQEGLRQADRVIVILSQAYLDQTDDNGPQAQWQAKWSQDPEGPRAKVQMAAHRQPVHALSFSPDGQCLAMASADHTVRLWQTSTGSPRGFLIGHDAQVRTVAFSPDGRTLVTGADDATIRLWDADTCSEIATLIDLPDGSWAALLPDGSYKLVGEHRNRFWWVVKNRRFMPGELDAYDSAVRRLPEDAPFPRP